MNNRIIEMAIKAGFNPVNCTGSNVPLFEKFAESIINEIELYIEESEGDTDYLRFLIDKRLKTYATEYNVNR